MPERAALRLPGRAGTGGRCTHVGDRSPCQRSSTSQAAAGPSWGSMTVCPRTGGQKSADRVRTECWQGPAMHAPGAAYLQGLVPAPGHHTAVVRRFDPMDGLYGSIVLSTRQDQSSDGECNCCHGAFVPRLRQGIRGKRGHATRSPKVSEPFSTARTADVTSSTHLPSVRTPRQTRPTVRQHVRASPSRDPVRVLPPTQTMQTKRSRVAFRHVI